MRNLHLQGMLLLLLAACGSASDSKAPESARTPANPVSCLQGGDGLLRAQLRGAIDADVDWENSEMSCEGGTRPDGQGIRAAFAGQLPATGDHAPRTLRFIFGIDLEDTAAGSAQALPTNLTVIVEGEKLLFATRGDDRCAVEQLERSDLPDAAAGGQRVRARGYCIGPAVDASGEQRLLLPTFEFTGLMHTGDTP